MSSEDKKAYSPWLEYPQYTDAHCLSLMEDAGLLRWKAGKLIERASGLPYTRAVKDRVVLTSTETDKDDWDKRRIFNFGIESGLREAADQLIFEAQDLEYEAAKYHEELIKKGKVKS